MVYRTTAADVKIIIDTSLADPDIESIIKTANVLVSAELGSAGLGEDLLTEIERYLTAHLIASTRERMAKKEGAGGASIEYAGAFGAGLDATPYGQTVKALDTSGRMSSLSGKRASMYAVKSFK